MSYRPTVLVDFDGVLHLYRRGWADGTVYDDPVPGGREALAAMAADGYQVVIFSTRPADQIRDAFHRWGWTEADQWEITDIKKPAVAQIDDRAIRFHSWAQAASDLRSLHPVRR